MLAVQQVEVSAITPWDNNPRVNDQAVEAVARSIRSFGFNVPILCDQDFTIVAGHVRWKAAKQLGMETVPVIVLTMSEKQREAFAIADNKTGQIAEWDFPRLKPILAGLLSQDFDLTTIGYSDAELEALLAPEERFDWEQLATDVDVEPDSTYVVLRVKVPAKAKEPLRKAVHKYAANHGILDKDSALTAGKVLQHILGVSR